MPLFSFCWIGRAQHRMIHTVRICTVNCWRDTTSSTRRWVRWLSNGWSVRRGLMIMLMSRYILLAGNVNVVLVAFFHGLASDTSFACFQLLFKVEGQNLTNQRTEPHKSLINRNVSRSTSHSVFIINLHTWFCLLQSSLLSGGKWVSPFFNKMSLRTKQRMLKEDAEIFKQKRFFEEQVIFSPNQILLTLWTYWEFKKKVVVASVPKLKPACPVLSWQLMELRLNWIWYLLYSWLTWKLPIQSPIAQNLYTVPLDSVITVENISQVY